MYELDKTALDRWITRDDDGELSPPPPPLKERDPLDGTVTFVPDPARKGYVEVEVEGESWPAGTHRLKYGFQTPQGIEVGDRVELRYQRYGNMSVWFAKKVG